MAITFRGSIATRYMMPQPGAECFVFENSARSRCTVNILRAVMQVDALSQTTSAGFVMPQVKARKGTATASGGVVMNAKAAFDSTINSPDSGVIIRLDPGYCGTLSSDIVITGTLKTATQKYQPRQMTGVEQFNGDDAGFADLIGSDGIVLKPGELLAMQWVQPIGKEVGAVAFFQLVWEEDQTDDGYTVSGNVTLSSVAVSGAKVLVVTDLDRDLPDPELEVLTTGAPGTWSKTLASGVKASVFVQSRSGETLYTSDGKPFIAKP